MEFTILTRRGRERVREVFTGRRVSSLSEDELAQAYAAGYEPANDFLVGRDPRTMTQDELRAMGHEPRSPMQAIREFCLDCCGGSSDEVLKCAAKACSHWDFRTGKNVWRAPASEAQREAARRSMAKLRGAASDPGILPDVDDEDAGSAIPPHQNPVSASDAD